MVDTFMRCTYGPALVRLLKAAYLCTITGIFEHKASPAEPTLSACEQGGKR